MNSLSRDAILAATDIQLRKVSVPEWGGEVYISPLTVADADQLMLTDPKKQSYRVKMIVLSLTDKDGNRLFTDDDIPALSKKSATSITRLVDEIQRSNVMVGEDRKELEGN